MKKVTTIFICVIVIILSSCSVDVPADTGTLPVVFDQSDIDDFQEITIEDPEKSAYLFTLPSGSDLIETIKEGSILSSGITDKTPYGFLQKVKAVEDDGSTVSIHTEPAALNEAFSDLHIDHAFDLSEDKLVRSTPLVRGVTFTPGSSSGRSKGLFMFNYNFLDVPLYENGSCSVKLSGNVSLDIDPRFILDIGFWKIDRIGVRVDVDEACELKAIASCDYHFKKDIEIFRHDFSAIVIQAGYVPIVLIPSITIVLTFDGNLAVSASVGIRQTAHLDGSLVYESSVNRWVLDQHRSSDISPILPDAEFSCGAKVSAGPCFQIMLYGIVGPYVRVGGFLDLDVTITTPPLPDPYLTLDAGLEAAIGVNLTPIADFLTIIGLGGINGRVEQAFPILTVRIYQLPLKNPDLVPLDLQAISSAWPSSPFPYGIPIDVLVKVGNDTDFAVTTPFTVNCLIYDENPDTGVLVLTDELSTEVPSLAAHTTSDYLGFQWWSREGADASTKRIVIKVDADSEVTEAVENNNDAWMNVELFHLPTT